MATTKKGSENPGKLLHSISLIHCGSGNIVNGGRVLRGKVAAVAIGPYWLPKPLVKTIAEFSSSFLEEIRKQGKPIEFVYVALHRNEKQIWEMKERGNPKFLDEGSDLDCFNNAIKQLGPGWLAVPFKDTKTRKKFQRLKTEEFCGLVFLGEDGETLTTQGLNLMRRWGAGGFPYSDQRIAELEKEEVARRANQTLESVLVTPNRDFVVKKDGTQVKVENFKGKVVGLFFTALWCWPCRRFVEQLEGVYQRLEGKLEVVIVSQDEDEVSFMEHHKQMPWHAVPYSDTNHRKQLGIWFNVEFIPKLAFLDEHGKMSSTNGVSLVYTYGADGFPFTPARIAELDVLEERKRAEQSIETLLIRNNRDYLLAPGSNQVRVSELLGKTVGLYFSARWSLASEDVTSLLAAVYEEVKREGKEFEVVFISCDRDDEECMKFYSWSQMPWLLVPFVDRPTKCQLCNYFGVNSIPTLVIIGPDGKTVTRDGVSVLSKYLAPGFPYTQEHLWRIDVANRLPMRVKILRHALHMLLLEDDNPYKKFECNICRKTGFGSVYTCKACKYYVHPDCAKAEMESDKEWEARSEEGWVYVGKH